MTPTVWHTRDARFSVRSGWRRGSHAHPAASVTRSLLASDYTPPLTRATITARTTLLLALSSLPLLPPLVSCCGLHHPHSPDSYFLFTISYHIPDRDLTCWCLYFTLFSHRRMICLGTRFTSVYRYNNKELVYII